MRGPAPGQFSLVEDLLWGEIDDKGHLDRVRDQVYPAIERRDG